MISVNIQSKSFGDHTVLRDIEFGVSQGETVAILGPSGIGKSTLLAIISGTDTNYVGSVDCPAELSFVFQEPTLLPWRSSLQNLTLVHEGLSHAHALDALDRVGLADKVDLFPNQLSLGQQRRLALARAFAGKPKALIMDEPFASLDHDTAKVMLKLTSELIQETKPATIFVTHSEDEANQLASRTLFLEGAPASLREN